MRVRRRSSILLTFLAGCFNPDPAKIIVSCDPMQPECPTGQVCIENRCAPPSDAAAPNPGSGDLGGTDSGLADLAQDSGCAAGGGTRLGTAFACPGTFSSGTARQRCAKGYKVCTSATGIDLTTCATLSGFFVADVPAYWMGTMGNETCGTSGITPMWYGCGNGSGLSIVRDGVRRCAGFPRVLECKGTWNCFSMHTLDTAENSAAKDGLLCCPG